jgi:uncharacterized cupredoxin-like copper-binding protein
MQEHAALVLTVALLAAPAAAAPGASGHSHSQHGGTAHGATTTDGQPGNPGEVSRTVRLEARDIGFNTRQIQMRAGETVKFVVTNKGQLVHEFAIASPQEHEEHRAMMQQMPDMVHEEPNVVSLQPGETRELVWKFGKDADIEFSCNLPGHREQGMKGAFRLMR